MAHVAMGSLHVIGVALGANMVEGVAVKLSASGIHNELPTAVVAGDGDKNVFIVLASPDRFPRPTPRDMFLRQDTTVGLPSGSVGHGMQIGFDPRNAEEFLIDSGQRGPYYNIGPSMMQEPTLYSGWMVTLHRGGAYTLTENCFVDSADIRVPGAGVKVGANGKFVYATTNVVGYVREYRGDGKITIVLDPRSA